jgi:S-adenosyl-L-methionine hydrolase (adenosine-forming)
MTIITLTTDWQGDDFYKGSVKGAILSHNIDALIVDITHQISPFNTAQAAFVLKNTFYHYPKGSVHILDINSEATSQNKHIAFRYNDHYFIGTDNGIFGLLLTDDNPQQAVIIEKFVPESCYTFPALYVFAPSAAFLSGGEPLEALGSPLPHLNKQMQLLPTINEAVIAGSVIYIDSYQNAITNISKELFEKIGKGRPFEILVQSYHYKINRINHTYNETTEGELLAIFNSLNLMEIAINRGNVAELLNIEVHSNIRIKFM